MSSVANSKMDTIEGPRFWWILFLLCVGLLLSALEGTIVSTALVSMASDLNDYQRAEWVIIAYLITYSGFLIIISRLSDIFGRKVALLTGISFFSISSLACGLARTLTQLIVFRTFQGIGGAGIYAITTVVATEMTKTERVGLISGIVGIVFVVSSAAGPLVGGAITSSTTWRWCFYFNVPSGAVIGFLLLALFPAKNNASSTSFKAALVRVDWLGCALCLGASITIVIPLQLGGDQYAWNRPLIIVLFVLGGLGWVVFAAWETWLVFMPNKHALLPLTPVKVIVRRVVGSCILTAMLTGVIFTSTIVYFPQRYQIQGGRTPVEAGLNMIPLLVISALSSIVAGILMQKKNICAFVALAGNVLQLLGLSLLTRLQHSEGFSRFEYAYQTILGMGIGTTLSGSFVLARVEVTRQEIASMVGTITQLRVFGGVIGVALCRAILASYLNKRLNSVVSKETLRSILSSVELINDLPDDQASTVRRVFGEGFFMQLRALMIIAAVNVVICLLTFRRHPKPMKETLEDAVNQDGNTVDAIPKDVESRRSDQDHKINK